MSQQFVKVGQTYFRQDDSGQIYPVVDRDTMRGLNEGSLGYKSVPNTRGLTFGSSTSVADGTPAAPAPGGAQGSLSTGGSDVDFGSLLKEKFASALESYKGVTNTSELEARRQSILRKQMLAPSYDDKDSEKNLTGEAKLSLLRDRGKEFEPELTSIEEQIARAKDGDSNALDSLTKMFKMAKEAGVFGVEEDHSAIYKEFLDAKNEGYTGTFTDYQNEDANRKRPVTNINTGGLTPYQGITAKNAVVDDFRGDPATTQYTTAAAGWSSLANIDTKSKTSADDIAAIYAFAKIMDPNSVVREGEYATIQKYAQSWAQSFGFNVQRILQNKEFLSPDAVSNMQAAAKARMTPLENAYNQSRSTYVGRLKELGADDSYLPSYGYEPVNDGEVLGASTGVIKVRRISDGVTGSIDASEFDPKLYTKI